MEVLTKEQFMELVKRDLHKKAQAKTKINFDMYDYKRRLFQKINRKINGR